MNNHQEEIVELFSKKGYILGVEDVKRFRRGNKKIPYFKPVMYKSDNSKMLKIIEDFINNSSIM